ncbi:MAG: 4Fe-4S dicluster domain-containing protein [Candidatus Omnitrophica bacterium]|nr:4Fe-4S dicluster domain-containing protein [Candidatus Omnitrophota bacterium]MCK5394217.1 4Fe-4S dicluster domain-containing protein [Candidatus Omnitrophota bacterium]MCK5492971.1 4Fe-4S dicluster domain-containing protein [Candidatus Omnitrophota bacterium]
MSKGKNNIKLSVFELRIKKDWCKGCQLCLVSCPQKYLELSSNLNKKGVNFIQGKEKNNCIGCGFCFFMCPEGCIEIYQK